MILTSTGPPVLRARLNFACETIREVFSAEDFVSFVLLFSPVGIATDICDMVKTFSYNDASDWLARCILKFIHVCRGYANESPGAVGQNGVCALQRERSARMQFASMMQPLPT